MITTHRIWKYGDNVNTDVIFPGKYTYTLTDPAEMARVALQDLDPSFAANAAQGDIIVAGRNWGNGSSREQAVTCLKALGIRAIIAHSFARIYYRNAINNGLYVAVSPAIVKAVEHGQMMQIDFEQHRARFAGKDFELPALPSSVQHIIDAGGLIPYLQQSHVK